MSIDINELVRAVKQAAVEAVQADSPMGMSFGTVTSASPLQIRVDQKKTLSGAQLILTNNVRDFTVSMSVSPQTGETPLEDHQHRVRVHLGLKTGEKVILLRCDGGQKFIVLDRWEAL